MSAIPFDNEGTQREVVRTIVNPDGTPIVSSTYVHDQGVPSDTWTVVHGLGKYPNVVVIDSSGNQLWCEVDYPDANTVVIKANGAFSGTAYLS
jgi:hypothetical protein